MNWDKVWNDLESGPIGLFKWLVIVVVSLFLLGALLRSVGIIGSTSVEHAVIKNSFQYKEGMQQRAAILQANIEEIDIKCMCSGCEVTEIEFLSVEHINGGGQEDRNKSGARTFYERLVKDNYPEDIEILCFNCNLSRGFHGYCPHEKH